MNRGTVGTKFSSPREYLEHLQAAYGKVHPPGVADPKFEEMTNAGLKKIDSSIAKLGMVGGLQLALEALQMDLSSALDPSEVERIAADIAIGVLQSGEANAFIARSPDGKYALVLCSGLMLLLHKYFKLVRGFVAPKDVLYCNRKPASELTKDDLRSYIADLVNIYQEHGAPYGPMIKLTQGADAEHSALLSFAELFILCHELGHYFNGDLDDPSAYSALLIEAEGGKYEENRDHEVEYRADVVGFGLYSRVLKKQGLDASSLEMLKPILASFNLFYALAGGASSTHPHPYDRVVRIVEHHFGPGRGQEMASALDKPEILPAFFESQSKGHG